MIMVLINMSLHHQSVRTAASRLTWSTGHPCSFSADTASFRDLFATPVYLAGYRSGNSMCFEFVVSKFKRGAEHTDC
jgi:hypothetical protein